MPELAAADMYMFEVALLLLVTFTWCLCIVCKYVFAYVTTEPTSRARQNLGVEARFSATHTYLSAWYII